MAKKVVPLPINGEDRKELITAIEATIHMWKRIEDLRDFSNREPKCDMCEWSLKYTKKLNTAYKLKLKLKEDKCRFCPAYAINHNRTLCNAIEKAYTNTKKGNFNPTAFANFRDKVRNDLDRLLLLYTSQKGTSQYRKHIVEQIKLSQKLAKKTTRRSVNEGKTKGTRNKQD